MLGHACPAFMYDRHQVYYYLTGGGETQKGPFRSRDLLDWEMSPYSPLTQNSVMLERAGMHELATRDGKIGPHFQQWWADLPAAQLKTKTTWLANVSKWSWGHSDFDWCCDDNQAPSYLLYMVTQQGHPEHWDTRKDDWFQAMGTVNKTILDWLRGYFPDDQNTVHWQPPKSLLAAAAATAGSN
eukprot:SAG22_NODE_2428_length_2581_cov_1.791700_2_plen_184_part_00